MGEGKGDENGDENVRAWDVQWGRGTEWKSIERDIDRERPSFFLVIKSIVWYVVVK